MSETTEKSLGLPAIVETWRRRRGIALATFVAPFAAAISLAIVLPDVYKGVATVLVERQAVSDTLAQAIVPGEIETRLESLSQQILGRARLQDLIDRFGLYSDLRGRASREALVERMRRDIRLEPKGLDPGSGRGGTIAFTLTYRGRDPRTVAAVANALASFYVDQDRKTREEETSGATAFLRQQLDEAKARLQDQDRRIGEFKKEHSGELPEQVEANLAALERFNMQLRLNGESQIRALERRDDLARKLAEAGIADPDGGADAVASRITRLKSELLDLQRKYRDKYPDVVRLKEEIAGLERQLAPAAGPPGNAADSRAGAAPRPSDPAVQRLQESFAGAQASIRALRDEERQLRRSIDAGQKRIEDAPQREQDLHVLSRDYLATKDLYESLLKRLQDAQIAENLEERSQGERFRILDEAVVPQEPSGPNRLAILLAGLAAALGLAIGATALAEQLDTSFHAIADLRAFTRVPVLVSIPPIVTDGDLRRRRRRRRAAMLPVALGLALIAGATCLVVRGSSPVLRLLTLR
jgi:polysaccharide biosynthesis transport protein